MNLKSLRSLCCLSVLGAWFAPAYGVMEMTDAERDVLPEVCRNQSNVSANHIVPRSKVWSGYLGRAYEDIHHYCWAVLRLNRTYRPDMRWQMKITQWHAAVGDIKYFLVRAPGDSPMLAEVLTVEGKIHLLLREEKFAKEAFERAMAVEPGYWRSYFHWALHLQNIGRLKEAGAIVVEGLAHAPNSKPLLTLAKELNVKPPPPKPKPGREDENKAPAEAAAAASAAPAPVVPPQ